MANHVNEFLNSLSTLPPELKSNFERMRELDQRSQDFQEILNNFCEGKIDGSMLESHGFFGEASSQIDQLYKSCVDLSDQKITLASRAYDLVDNHISRLDKDIKKIENDFKQGNFQFDVSTEVIKGNGSTPEEKRANKSQSQSDRVKGVNVKDSAALTSGGMVPDVDLPVDPNEPTYCFCEQVSYGEMIACDNPDCNIEWFHFGCVGIKERPKGKWYCPQCKPNFPMKRKR